MEDAFAEAKLLMQGLSSTMLGLENDANSSSLAPPSLLKDSPVSALFATSLFLMNWALRLLVVEPLVTQAFNMSRLNANKFAQSFLEALMYGTFTCIGIPVVLSQPWLWPSVDWWKIGDREPMRADLRCYYIMYMGRYVQGFVSVLLEPKRKDFVQMLLHSSVTVFVILLSYMYSYSRVGAITMLLLDPADVPLHLAKMSKYVAESTKRCIWQKIADRFFETFAVTFFVTRLVLFSYVVWSCSVEGPPNMKHARHVGWTCLALMNMLLILQYYWFYLIMQVAVRVVVQGKGAEDVRSDDEASPENSLRQAELVAAEDVHMPVCPASTQESAAPEGKRKTKRAVEEPKQHFLPGLHTAALAAPILFVFGLQVWVMHRDGDLGWVEAELKLLLGSLRAIFFGGEAIARTLSHSPPDIPRDAAVFAVFAVAFFILNWGLRLLIVEPWTRWVLKLRRLRLAKFVQSVMEVVIYGSFMLIGLRVVPSQEWVWPSAKWWMGFAEGGHETMRADLRCYYIMYAARYFQAIVSVLLEPMRKDVLEMLLHHMVTVVVILISYVYGWNRIGVVVMVLLDPADVPLHLAKLCKYSAEATGRSVWHWMADRLFEAFAVVFFVTRIVLYGYVCWSAHIEATRYFPKGPPEWTCVALLYTLLLLQIYWFSLILKVAVQLLRGDRAEDPRSESETESEGEAAQEKKDK